MNKYIVPNSMSWNPSPVLGTANWQGSPQVATKNQLLSSVSGLYADLQDLSGFDFQNLNVSTLTVRNWISAPVLYVSTIRADNVDISGIAIDASGILFAPLLSSQSAVINNITNVSVMSFSFKPTFTGNIQVSFDLGLGQAIGGFLAGLGAAVGGAFIGVGTALGLAIQGAEQGIATMIAGRPQNFITNNTYETINFTSQLQVSTLGNAYPVYSTIFRTVSSVSANQVPGREIFTSSFFYPGQICIRSVSDPINLITGDSNLNTSTIQSFGQWTPLEGLEPTNVVADSVSTNKLSTGSLFADIGSILTLDSYSAAFSNLGVAQSASMNYQAPLQFQTGATNYAAFVGDLNRLYCYNTTGWIFSQEANVEMGSLYVGSNANESLLNISSIYSQGQIRTVDFYASTITAEQITAVSTLFITSTNIEVVTSTQTVVADNLFVTNASIANFISSFSFTTGVGNPSGPFDINKNYSLTSTSYNGVSSLTNNILNYQMNLEIQDQTSFNLNIAETQFGVLYKLSPTNVEQWASTLMIFNDYQNPGGIELPVASVFQQAGLTGTFDIQTQYNPNTPGYYSAFSIVQDWIPGSEFSTFSTFLSVSGPNVPNPPLVYQRYTIGPSGWITSIVNSPVPYETLNSNIFQITQDINDVTIATTDRLNLEAGEIFFKGAVNLNDINVNTFNTNTLIVDCNATIQNATVSSMETFYANFSSIMTNRGDILPQISQLWTSNYSPPSALSSIVNTLSTSLLHSEFNAIVNRPFLTTSLGANNDITLSKLGYWLVNGVPRTDNYALGTIVVYPIDNTSRIFTDNAGFGLASNLQVVNLSNASANNIGLYINFPSAVINIPANSATTLYWNNSTSNWQNITYAPWTPLTDPTQVDITQGYNWLQLASPSTIFNSNVTIGGTLSMTGKTITTFQMTWNHDITTATQHGFGAVQVQDGNGNLYSASQWRMVHSVYECYLNSAAYAMNSWEVSPAVDGNGNYILNYSLWFTTTMITTFQMYFWVDVVMYPREMVNAQPAKNWGNI